MKNQISQELIEAKKTDLAEKIKPIHDKEKAEKIFWSVRERGDFVAKLKNEMKGNQSNEQLLSLISNEIDNELTENKFDEAANDYAGEDDPDKPKYVDENVTRQIIESAWENATKDLTPKQKTKLENQVTMLLENAHDDVQREIFNDVKDKAGTGIPWFKKDLMVTEEEAEKIAGFIKTQAEAMKKKSTAPTVAANEIPATPAAPATPEAIIAASQAKLCQTGIEDWAQADAQGKFPQSVQEKNQKLFEKITKDKKWNEVLEKLKPTIAQYGIDQTSFESALKNFVGQNPNWFIKTKLVADWPPIEGEINQEHVDSIFTHLKSFDEYFKADGNKDQLNNFFKLKGESDWQKNPDWLIRYFAFNEVSEDLKTFDEWREARKQSNKENVEVTEAKPEVVDPKEKTGAKNQDQGSSEEKFQQASDSFEQAMKAANDRDYWSAIKLLFNGLMSFMGAIGAWTKSIWRDIPPETEAWPVIGGFMAWIRKSGEENEKKDATAAPTPAPEQTLEQKTAATKTLIEKFFPNKTVNAEGLKLVSMKELFDANDDAKRETLGKKSNPIWTKEDLKKLQDQLGKKIEAGDAIRSDANKKVFDAILEKPDYLKA